MPFRVCLLNYFGSQKRGNKLRVKLENLIKLILTFLKKIRIVT